MQLQLSRSGGKLHDRGKGLSRARGEDCRCLRHPKLGVKTVGVFALIALAMLLTLSFWCFPPQLVRPHQERVPDHDSNLPPPPPPIPRITLTR